MIDSAAGAKEIGSDPEAEARIGSVGRRIGGGESGFLGIYL